MGKAIAVVFFVVGFIIFLVIKYAVLGVKAAHKAVNDPVGFQRQAEMSRAHSAEDARTIRLTGAIVSLLSLQVSLMGLQRGALELNTRATDDYSIGYVFGFFDGVLQSTHVEANVQGLAIGTLVFLEVFGSDKGAVLFRRALDIQASANRLFDAGQKRGGEDAVRFGRDSNATALGWRDYVRNGNESAAARRLSPA